MGGFVYKKNEVIISRDDEIIGPLSHKKLHFSVSCRLQRASPFMTLCSHISTTISTSNPEF